MFGKIKNGFNRLVWKLLPGCKDITALISRSLEKDLSFREKLVMKTHLYTCLACRRYLTQLAFMSEVLGKQEEQIEKGEYPPRLGAEASERLKNALKSSKLLILFVLVYGA
jgi:predicted anti-sigma-YlaC factor YlaD